MNASHLPSSLYHRLLSSHLQIAAIAGLLLCICLMMIVYFQHGSSTIATVRLPSSMASARIVHGIEASNSQLRSWVLLGSVDHIRDRQRTWAEQIEPAMNELDKLTGDNDLASMAELRQKMLQLKESQWWVEDVATTMGNNPARLIYERDLLPIYERIQHAVIGLNGDPTDDRNISEIQLTAALTHQNLSEAVRQLSEAVRTGSVAEIKDFHDGSETVQKMLAQLANQIEPGDDARPLLDWILREYHVYEQLAKQTITIRQSDDWNRALYILRSETEPLATDVKNALIVLQRDHNNLLQEDISRSALMSRVGSFVTLSLIVGLGLIAWAIARTRSNRLVAPIEALAEASDQLAGRIEKLAEQDNRFNAGEIHPVMLPVEGPREIAHLTERFNDMGQDLIARTKDLKHANRELQEYTHVITHDLKPPLINIKGHAALIKTQLQELETLAKKENTTKQRMRETVLRTVTQDIPESVNFIDMSITKTNTLIGGVLDNSRLLFRNVAIEEVDMNNLVKQVVALFSHRFDDVDFQCGILPVISTDTFLMEHVFSNLIDNALKYLDPNRVGQIKIGGEIRDGEAQFFVTDNGIGLNDETIDVFKLFKQADGSSEGAGVGLALVRTMLAKLGGRIWHKPNNGQGATFMFCVPVHQDVNRR